MRYLGRNNVTRRKLRHAVELQQRLGITLFTIDSTKIAYVGQKKLAAALGVTRAVRPQMICRGAAQSMGSFWPAVYAAWLAAVGDKNGGAWISRARLTELWGIGETQQRKWEQSEHVSVQHNVGRFITPAEGDESEDTKRILATLPRDKDGESHSWERGEQTYYQTVNCYRPRFAMSTPMGATRKAAKYASDSTEAVEIVATARGKDQRVFFSQAWFKANSWHMRDEGSSLQEAPGERIVTRRKRRNPGTGLLDPYSTKFSVFDACSLRPCLRGAKL